MFNFNTVIHMSTCRLTMPKDDTKFVQEMFSFMKRMQSAIRLLCCSGEESTNGANLHLCFSENIRFRVLMKNRTFLCKIKTFHAHPVLHISKS